MNCYPTQRLEALIAAVERVIAHRYGCVPGRCADAPAGQRCDLCEALAAAKVPGHDPADVCTDCGTPGPHHCPASESAT